MDEALFTSGGDDDESDVLVEANDVDAGAAGDGLISEVWVGFPGTDVHLLAREEGGDDVLRGLLGEAESLDAEARVTKDGGDKISAGDGTRAGSLAGAVEVPLGAEPAAHDVGEG